MSEPALGQANAYGVDVRRVEGGWSVAVLDPGGRVVSARACNDEPEARTYASTVRQHIYWLSEDRFRQYYGLPGAKGSE